MMKQNICVTCGRRILKSGRYDPYICRECEKDPFEERFAYLDG